MTKLDWEKADRYEPDPGREVKPHVFRHKATSTAAAGTKNTTSTSPVGMSVDEISEYTREVGDLRARLKARGLVKTTYRSVKPFPSDSRDEKRLKRLKQHGVDEGEDLSKVTERKALQDKNLDIMIRAMKLK